jgi:hypothetical protein
VFDKESRDFYNIERAWKDGKEISVNPYAALKYVENRKIKAYSDR